MGELRKKESARFFSLSLLKCELMPMLMHVPEMKNSIGTHLSTNE